MKPELPGNGKEGSVRNVVAENELVSDHLWSPHFVPVAKRMPCTPRPDPPLFSPHCADRSLRPPSQNISHNWTMQGKQGTKKAIRDTNALEVSSLPRVLKVLTSNPAQAQHKRRAGHELSLSGGKEGSGQGPVESGHSSWHSPGERSVTSIGFCNEFRGLKPGRLLWGLGEEKSAFRVAKIYTQRHGSSSIAWLPKGNGSNVPAPSMRQKDISLHTSKGPRLLLPP